MSEKVEFEVTEGAVNWKHPKLQALLSKNARLSIELDLVESLLFDPEFEMRGCDYDYETALVEKVSAYRDTVAKLVKAVTTYQHTTTRLMLDYPAGTSIPGSELDLRSKQRDEMFATLAAYEKEQEDGK